MSQVSGAASGRNTADIMRSASNSSTVVQSENIRPTSNKNSASANLVRQTRAASKRAAMEDASRTISIAPNPHAKKRPALANLSNNTHIPTAQVRISMSKTVAENYAPAAKSNARTPIHAQDVETQMAGLSVLQKKGEVPQSKDGRENISRNSTIMVIDNDENMPRESETVSERESKSSDEKLAMPAGSVSALPGRLPLEPSAVQALLSAKLHWPITQDSILGERNCGECKYTDIDVLKDPQMCSMYAIDIYQHLRIAELKRRPTTNFMEVIQNEINCSMRGILVDWLVEVAEEYKLVPDTLYLTISYIDRFLSTSAVNRQRLQLLGVSSMLIAAKYEEICAPQVEEFCYITDNTYGREEVLEMERRVLSRLHFELTTPTTKTFLRRFIRAAQTSYKVASLQLEFLGNYLAELTLVEYSFLQYLPSMVAASAVFLAKLTLDQETNPWNPTLQHYTGYQCFELKNCVKALFELQCNTKNCTLPAIREKYRQHKFKSVANLKPPNSLPSEYFLDLVSKRELQSCSVSSTR